MRLVDRYRDLQVARGTGNVGDQRSRLGCEVLVGEGCAKEFLGAEALLLDHAPDDAPLGIHDFAGIGKVARHLHVGALDDADAEAEIAAVGQRRRLRTAPGLPKILALGFE